MNSREIIHQFVNMARHPEAKDLAEALEMATKFDDCLYECRMVKYGGDSIHYAKMTKLEYFKKSLEIHNVYLDVDNLNFSILATQKPNLCNLKIIRSLGRPITAFDVCWALQKTHTDLMIRFNGGNYIRVGRMMGGEFDCWFWLEAKNTDGTDIFLTEWRDDVCDKIAEEI